MQRTICWPVKASGRKVVCAPATQGRFFIQLWLPSSSAQRLPHPEKSCSKSWLMAGWLLAAASRQNWPRHESRLLPKVIPTFAVLHPLTPFPLIDGLPHPQISGRRCRAVADDLMGPMGCGVSDRF